MENLKLTVCAQEKNRRPNEVAWDGWYVQSWVPFFNWGWGLWVVFDCPKPETFNARIEKGIRWAKWKQKYTLEGWGNDNFPVV